MVNLCLTRRKFLLTRLIRGATTSLAQYFPMPEFLLTRLIRGATIHKTPPMLLYINFYSRASYEARLSVRFGVYLFDPISTHAPHTRRDSTAYYQFKNLIISTHAPHTRRDFNVFNLFISATEFLLTRLIRGATISVMLHIRQQQFLLTRLIRGATK